MLIDARELEPGALVRTDVCVIGAGAAGISLAREFVGHHLDVCLLESGGLEREEAAQDLSRGDSVGDPYFPLHANRERSFGGTTNLWAGWCRPLDAFDLAPRPWIPGSGWPLGHEDLLPYYRPAHALCQLGAFEYDPGYWERALGSARLPLSPDQVVTKIYRLSPPTRFGSAYRAELASAPNVRVLHHATALALETGAMGAAVTRLRAGCREGRRFAVSARCYILAAGGIENARLLLVSNGVQTAGLGNAHDLVGRYFMEHIHFPGVWIRLTRAGAARTALYQPRGRPAVARLFLPAHVQERERLLNWSASLERWRPGLRSIRALLRRRPRQRRGMLAMLQGTRLQLHHTVEAAPNPASRVTLGPDRDALGMQRVRLEWRTDPRERATCRRAHELLDAALRHAGLGRLEVDGGEDDGAWPPPPLQGLRGHHMGTTRMSRSPRQGVVDERCRVHGLGNLYVAGSSVFPTAGAGTPTLTILALALRLADHIKTEDARGAWRHEA